MSVWMVEDQAAVENRLFALREGPDPQLVDDEILIQIRACDVCRTDVHIVEGASALKTLTRSSFPSAIYSLDCSVA